MKKTVGIVLIAIAVASVVLLALFQPQLLEKVWLWLVGFAALIYGGFQRLVSFFTGSRRLDEIEASNEQLAHNLDQARKHRAEADARLKRLRAEHQAALAQLQARLAEEERRARAAEAELARVRKMSYREYFESLPEEERRQVTEDMWSRVDFGF